MQFLLVTAPGLLHVSTLRVHNKMSSAANAAHVLKHGSLSVAAIVGGGGIGWPGGTTIKGASNGNMGETESGTELMLGLVQFKVAAEQVPAQVWTSL